MSFIDNFNEITCDMWQYLAECNKPIVVYGMGDGADKIINELEKRNLSVSGIFASDGFVRDKTFRSHKVVTYSQIKSEYNDFIVLVSFGTKLDDVIDNIKKIANERVLFAPDVPVFGDGIFDLDYFRINAERLENIYTRLADDTSRSTYINAIKYRLTGKIEYLFDCEAEKNEAYETLFIPRSGSTYIDVGAYNGDTIREFVSYSGEDITVHAFEPDTRNFKKLSEYTQTCGIKSITLHNAAAWNENTELEFFSRSGRNSASSSFRQFKTVKTKAVALDSCVDHADFIKIDAEGADINVIKGAKHLIKRCSPDICVAAYHRTEDYFAIPEEIMSYNNDYDIYIRHNRHIPCWDTNFYFKKKV